MVRVLVPLAFVLLVLPSAARADRAAADRCAAQLPANSKQIYDGSLANVLAGMSPKDAVTKTARAMVMGGQMPRAEARPAATAAGECLKLTK